MVKETSAIMPDLILPSLLSSSTFTVYMPVCSAAGAIVATVPVSGVSDAAVIRTDTLSPT